MSMPIYPVTMELMAEAALMYEMHDLPVYSESSKPAASEVKPAERKSEGKSVENKLS